MDFARINSDLTPTTVHQNNNRTNRTHYTQEQVLRVLKSHLDVYDGIKDVSAHLNFMRELFGESSSQYRNGAQYNKNFHKTLDQGDPNLGQSMPANWADGTLELIKDRPVQFINTLNACRKIYDATDNGNMLRVIQKWR